MNKRKISRYVSLAMLVLLVMSLFLLSGCAAANQNLTEEGLVDVSSMSTEVKMGLYDYVKVPFAYLLEFLYNFCNNYGLALILFALIVKVIMLPFAALSKKGMMKMTRLTPQVKALEAKYGDDKQKYQEEVNKLYREEGASGCSGCLWSFLPLLIIFPLYAVIREPITWLMFHGNVSQATLGQVQNVFLNAVKSGVLPESLKFNGVYWQMTALGHVKAVLPELQAISPAIRAFNTSFLGIDLATVPQVFFWNNTENGWWNAIGQFLLPLLSAGINWLSMWISTKLNNTVITDEKGEKDEEMAKSADPANTTKSMTYMMPLMSAYIGFIAPAGLSIYWIVQGLFQLVQDVILTKYYRKVYDAEDEIKRQRAAKEAAEEAERERIRAEKRAANPEGIIANTSKKKLQQKQRAEQAAKEAAYQAQLAPEQEPKLSEADQTRPFRRGRNYDPDRYKDDTENEE